MSSSNSSNQPPEKAPDKRPDKHPIASMLSWGPRTNNEKPDGMTEMDGTTERPKMPKNMSSRRASVAKTAGGLLQTSGQMLKSTVMAPVVAGKAVYTGGVKAGQVVGSGVAYGSKAVVGGGKACVDRSCDFVVGGGKAVVGGGKYVVKGSKKVFRSAIGATSSGSNSRSMAKQSKWDAGIDTIDSLLRPDSDTYNAMTPEQRKALAGVKKLLLKGPSDKQDKISHLPQDLIEGQEETVESNRRSSLKSTKTSLRSSTAHILQEYAGVRASAPGSLFEDLSDYSEQSGEDTFEASKQSFATEAALTEVLDFDFVAPEFTKLSKPDQVRVFELLSWDSLSKWSFDIFELNDVTGGHPLLFVGWAILGSPYAQSAMAKECGISDVHVDTSVGYSFVDDFKIPPRRLCNYLRIIERDYHSENPYHNEIHAADVVQSLHTFIQMTFEGKIFECTPKDHFLAILLSAVVHDVSHPGKTNAFNVSVRTEVAVMYNDSSVLENWHIAYAFARMLDLSLSETSIRSNEALTAKLNNKRKKSECNILCNVSTEEFNTIRGLMIEAVLHTDMTKHFPMVNAAKGMLQLYDEEGAQEIAWKGLMFMLHMADISSQAKPAPLFRKWTERCMEEFFNQGDEEAKLGLPISPNCDRNLTKTPDSQTGFIKFVVEPAYQVLGLYIPRVQDEVLPIITNNYEYWMQEKEQAEADEQEEMT